MQVYLADLAALKAAVGSSDTALFDAITVTWPSDNEAKDSLSDREALQVLIDGGPFERTQQGRYFAALEAICARIGEHIDDFTFHHGDLDELDDEFDVPEGLSIERFLYAWFDEFPSLDGERAGGGLLDEGQVRESAEPVGVR
ncbi:hypothetical protein VMT65_23010 [Nocardia sp. CDC153]|uniref:DUF7691 family protein n=1 Tax=Nocardia sp. CDC153 TaxID=3112167 RepID=UPI002DBEE87B|nr:hypothetical protein [Nocardia sp. CDC153]MEC3955923.1 hypothetical protein [Nocardia sp. CDC153]